MYDFLRIACAVPGVSVADPLFQTEQILKMVHHLNQKGAQIIVFPELSLTSYTCGDLFFQKTLLDSVKEALIKILNETRSCSSVFILGLPVLAVGQLYNCAAILYHGRIFGLIPKNYLPVYQEYYEHRWFSSASALPISFISSNEIGLSESYDIPIGKDIIFEAFGARFSAEICEDLWATIPPSSYLSLGGAEIIFNCSASNETIGKRRYRESLLANQSARCLCAYAYASAGRRESTTDLIFSGYAAIYENGVAINESKKLISSNSYIISDIDLGKLRADRVKMKTFAENAMIERRDFRYISVCKEESTSDGSLYPLSRFPFVPSKGNDRMQTCLEIFEIQLSALQKRAEIIGYRPVVGVSGGLDSTLALLVTAGMMKKAGKPIENITGISMPCFGTTKRTKGNAEKLMRALGVTAMEIDIKEACLQHCRDIQHPQDRLDVTYENIQARERTQVLMDYACKIGGYVIGTGDLSELALGWCTYNADHMSMYSVNAGVPKTLIRWMIESISASDFFPEAKDVLQDILDTPVSPELLPPDENGNIAQQTEEIVGPYALHDFFLYYMLRYGFSPDKIFFLAKRAFSEEFKASEILNWEKVFYKRFFSQQFKRSCLPDGVKIGSVCLSPRGDWRMPSDASANIWLKILEKMEASSL